MGISWITPYIKNCLTNIRTSFRQKGLTVWALTTGAGGWRSYDAYRRIKPQWVKTSHIFSGALAWGKTSSKFSTEGGYYERADATIIASLDDKSYFTGSGFSTETQVTIDGMDFKIIHTIETEDTNEMVLYCQKVED